MLTQSTSNSTKLFHLLSKPVVVNLMGGLGNQLFQYAAARSQADRLGTDLFFDISSYDQDPARQYELNVFNIRGRVLLHKSSSRGLMQSLQRFILLKNIKSFKEQSFRFDPQLETTSSGSWMTGYFQSEKYFSINQEQIRKDLTLKGPLSELTSGLATKIRASQSAVCLHIRRGDYVSNPNANSFHGVIPIQYYNQAVETIKKSYPDLHLFLFSDDPDWVGANLNFGVPQTVMKANPPERGVEDLYLMSLCQHHIIANSSFSWWGAWLAQAKNQIVIAPKRWFLTGEVDDSDLIPEKWIRI